MSVIPVTMRVDALNANSRRPGVSERRRLSFNTPVLVIVISDGRGVFDGLVIGAREHFAGTRYKFVERRQAHPDIIGIGRRRRGKGNG